jgi:lysine-N-methylase
MKVLQPSYYDDFECIADKCKDTCCQGWKITIDKKSFLKYRKVKGEFGCVLNKNIKRFRNLKSASMYGEFVGNKDNNKCYFLNNNNLCEVYINKGPDYLCDTCAKYPRLMYIYQMNNNENMIERNLTLSCPRVAEILVNTRERFNFIMKDEPIDKKYTYNEIILKDKYAEKLYDLLWEGRSFSIEIAQFREIPIWKRLAFMKITEGRLQKLVDSREFTKTNEVIENLRNEITKQEVIDSLDNMDKISNIVKMNLITSVLQVRIDMGLKNTTFMRMISNINELIRGKTQEEIQLISEEKQTEFNEYFKNREYILENYIVYNLYTIYMKALKTKDLNKEIIILMMNYSVVKLFLLSTWVKNNGELTNTDIVDALYCCAREIEHSNSFMELLYQKMKAEGYDSIGYLVTMIY